MGGRIRRGPAVCFEGSQAGKGNVLAETRVETGPVHTNSAA